jgi:methyl-accepting chemotaxis protein
MKITFGNRVLLTIAASCAICTTAAIFVSRARLQENGEQGLIEKSRAILSRLEVGRDYVADMGMLETVAEEMVKRHPNGVLPDEDKLKVLKNVPVFAALKLGAEGAEKEKYRFRVASKKPRRDENQASADEAKVIDRFEADPSLQEWVERSKDGSTLAVLRPVRISEKQGCLLCHGHPSKSPWGNGRDILGYPMENLKDGEIRATFAVVSSTEPVHEVVKAATGKIVGWGLVFTLVALGFGFLVIRRPIRRLNQVSERLGVSGVELGNVSGQISSVSQSLSAASTESAASLEQTVSSIEELTSMVGRNADSAREAAGLSQGAREAAKKGEVEIRELITAINEISTSSKKIEEIINVIDDIAFQTNLLALNAAVEAARAGDQGKGFAVVADAVRNLAQRSAAAAKDITALIKDSVGKVDRGSSLASNSERALGAIVASVQKMAEINGEIASASSEQASGISQISKAMNQLDQTTQQNAAASEESAASAEQMALQASSLQRLVQDLTAVIHGRDQAQPSSVPSESQWGANHGGPAGGFTPQRRQEVFPESAMLEGAKPASPKGPPSTPPKGGAGRAKVLGSVDEISKEF